MSNPYLLDLINYIKIFLVIQSKHVLYESSTMTDENILLSGHFILQ